MPDAVGFFTDTTICIGCKACQVACHQWNDLPAEGMQAPAAQRRSLPLLSGDSYDNTRSLSDVNWRHVKFIEQFSPDRKQAAWLMMSDVCKHCVNAPCLEVCPTSAILRTEFDTVYINEPACNGCRDCVTACPFGVIHMSMTRHVAQKCTFCYDRLKEGLSPSCAQACPTGSIQFGKIPDLRRQARARLAQVQRERNADNEPAWPRAQLYGEDEKVLGGLNAFYLLVDKPETYALPPHPKVPSRAVPPSSLWSVLTAILTGLGVLFAFRGRPNRPLTRPGSPGPGSPSPGSPSPGSPSPPPSQEGEVTS
jgi:formate dehydrogenase iron-sulfur subunit